MIKYLPNILFFVAGLAVFINELRKLLTTSVFSLPFGDDVIIYYLKCLFYFLALPLFFICETLEFFGVIPEESANHYHIHLFYYLVYVVLIVYGAMMVFGKFI